MNFSKKTLMAFAVIVLALFTLSFAEAANPKLYSNGERITITGKVLRTNGDMFVLDYGKDNITVEMDDWDSLVNEADLLKKNETVTVKGRIDKDLFETRTIEAGTVYVHDRNIFYFADSADEEFEVYSLGALHPEKSWVSIIGRVKNLNGSQFDLDTGFNDFKIETKSMDYNPLDDKGFQKIKKGDRVSVSGVLGDDFFLSHEIRAKVIVSLASGKK